MIKLVLFSLLQEIRTLSNPAPVSGLVKAQRAILPSPAANKPSENVQTTVLAFQETQVF